MRMNRRKFVKSAGVAAAGAAMSRVWPVRAAEPVTLRYWTFIDPKGTGPRERAQNQIVESFLKKYPSVKVEMETLPWDKLASQFVVAAQAGNAPDVTRIQDASMADIAAAGVLAPLDGILPDWSAKEAEDFPGYEAGVLDKTLYALYLENRIFTLWYRRDLLEKAKLPVPRTWDELAKSAKALQTDKIVGLFLAMSREKQFVTMKYFFSGLWSRGGDFLDAKSKALFNSPAGVGTVEWLAAMANVHKVMPASVVNQNSDNQMDAFRAGSVAFALESTHRVLTVQKAQGVGQNLQVAAVPGMEPGKPAQSVLEGWMLGVSATSKHKKEAGAFVRHHTSAEGMVINASVGGEMPARGSAFKDPWFRSDAAKEMRGWAEILTKLGRPIKYPVGMPQLQDMLVLGMQNTVVSKADAKKMLDEVAAKWNTGVK
jgi:multiple sugar transport system substrate-binding protein